MILTRRQIPSVLDALLNMDGDPKNPSKFSAKTRYALGKNARLLQARFEDMEKVRAGLIRQLAPTTHKIDPGTPEAMQFSEQWDAFREADTEDFPNLMKFTLGELNLDVNPLPIAVLSKLGPILIEDDAS